MFRINGAFEIRTDLGILCRVGGEEIDLRPKTFQTLLFLVRNRSRLITKDELTAHLWSDTAVTDDALVQCIVELRKALGDAAREPRFIKTVPKLGYRFVGDVEELPSQPPAREEAAPPVVADAAVADQPRVGRWSPWPVSIAVSLVLVTVATAVLMNSGTSTETAGLDPTPGRPGIAVMFLDNQSHTEDIDWMRQGLAEMLITGLSRSDQVSVLGRKHLLTLLGRVNHPVDQEIPLDVAREVARRSRASYLLMGSFARLGEKTRIDVRIETLDDKEVASETLTVDRPEDVLTQVDLLAWKLARYFDDGVEKPAAMAASGLTTNLEAYRAYSLGLSKAIAYHSEEAVTLFERALELDPNFVMAQARLGYVYGVTWPHPDKAKPYLEAAFKQSDRLRESDRLYIQSWHAMAIGDFVAAIEPLQRLIRLYPYELEAYNRLARLLNGERRPEDAVDVARRGLLIDPESTELNNTLGGSYGLLGRHADAIAAHRRYVALAPHEPNSHDSLGLSLQIAGRYAESEPEFVRALEVKPDFELAVAHLANVHFQTGRYRSAEKLYERYLGLVTGAGERARAYQAIAIIRARHGRHAEALAAAKASDVERVTFFGGPPWGVLTVAAMLRQPMIGMPPPERFEWYSDRGSRASLRAFLWLSGQDALIRHDPARGLEMLRRSLLENSIYWSVDPFEDGLALAYLELERWDDAIAEFGRVLRANPQYPRAHYFLARAYQAKGDTGAARAALQQFLSLWSRAEEDVPEVIDAKARLARLQS
jgi:DNA-binding winged helix-turn-helix (wHTH) protein/tetratricopeptide (TPR) repeat protein